MKITENFIKQQTDKYFSTTKKIVQNNGDSEVVYGFFVRKPSIYAVQIALNLIMEVIKSLDYKIEIFEN